MHTYQRKNIAHGSWLLALFVIALSGCPERKVEPVLEWPQFEASPEELTATYERAIERAEGDIEVIVSQPQNDATFATTFVALDKVSHEFHMDWNRVKLLWQTHPDEAVRNRAGEVAVDMDNWYTEHVLLNEALYERLNEFSTSSAASRVRDEDRRLMEETMARYVREGMELTAEDRALLKEQYQELSGLTSGINTNIRDAEGLVEFTRDDLAGLSEDQLLELEFDETAQVYRVKTALRVQFNLVMQHAEQADTRLRALTARLGRAMAENGAPIIDVVRIRAQIASLLGYNTWADFRTAPRMAGSAAPAEEFLTYLDDKLAPIFQAEQIVLRDLKREELNDPNIEIGDLNLEDIEYYINKWRERDYSINEDEVRTYFAAEPTMRRIFDLYEEVFSLTITMEDAPETSWAPGVKSVMIADAHSGRTLGVIYLDLYPRPGKYGHFATFKLIQGRKLTKDTYQAPVCAIVGNFTGPQGDRPALWSYAEVSSILHELGHALHETVTQAKYAQLAGSNVPLDFFETPSQFFERWLQDVDVLKKIAVHYQTNEPISDEMAQQLVAASKVATGHYYKRQVALGRSDFLIHMYENPEQVPPTPEELFEATNAVYNTYYPVPADTGLIASFGHLFSGFDAGYYSYAWSDAIAADIASVFRQSDSGFLDQELGMKLREEILEVGNSRPVEESIRAFLGRDWTHDAFFDELTGSGMGSGTVSMP